MFRPSGVAMASIGGTSMPPYNNGTLTLSAGDTTETWKFYRGSTQVAQWVLVYTDSTRATLVSFDFSDLSA